jgi:hypothetical protein
LNTDPKAVVNFPDNSQYPGWTGIKCNAQPVTENPSNYTYNYYFISYIYNLNIDWNLSNFNLETFQLIQNGIINFLSTQNLTIEKLYLSTLKSTPTPTQTVIYFNKQLKEAADKREQTKGTSIFNLTSWTNPTNKQPNSDCKMFIIMYYLVLISISSSPIITQNSIDCMYSVLNGGVGLLGALA